MNIFSWIYNANIGSGYWNIWWWLSFVAICSFIYRFGETWACIWSKLYLIDYDVLHIGFTLLYKYMWVYLGSLNFEGKLLVTSMLMLEELTLWSLYLLLFIVRGNRFVQKKLLVFYQSPPYRLNETWAVKIVIFFRIIFVEWSDYEVNDNMARYSIC